MILSLLTALKPVNKEEVGAFDTADEIKPGDEVIGELSGNLLALCICIMEQRALYESLAEKARRLLEAYDQEPNDPNLKTANQAIDEVNELNFCIRGLDDVFLNELFEVYRPGSDFVINIRKGFRVVKYEQVRHPRTHMFAICLPCGPYNDKPS